MMRRGSGCEDALQVSVPVSKQCKKSRIHNRHRHCCCVLAAFPALPLPVPPPAHTHGRLRLIDTLVLPLMLRELPPHSRTPDLVNGECVESSGLVDGSFIFSWFRDARINPA